MASSSLRYSGRQGRGSGLEITLKGDVIYSGDASGFFEWEFRTMLKYKSATKQEDLPKTVHKIIESLRGDAFQIAMDLTIDKLSEKNGIPTLISLIKQQCFPTKALEAK